MSTKTVWRVQLELDTLDERAIDELRDVIWRFLMDTRTYFDPRLRAIRYKILKIEETDCI